tara:strand:+ start:804 stop:1592 length:789 start_codon:yes stop_codon:yes gene_type:complete
MNTLDIWTVILCGGRGKRMEELTLKTPKPLLNVHGKPILWYIINILISKGLHRFIFPLGYKGKLIDEFIKSSYYNKGVEIICVETGADTLIKERINKISNLLPEDSDFLLINSDTIFDFDIDEMYQMHISNRSLLTLSTVEVISTWGLVVEKDGELDDFSREREAHYLSSEHDDSTKGYIYSGISFINKKALKYLNDNDPRDFEENLYSRIIKMGKASHYKLDGLWYAIDTQKDLEVLHILTDERNDRAQSVKKMKDELSNI